MQGLEWQPGSESAGKGRSLKAWIFAAVVLLALGAWMPVLPPVPWARTAPQKVEAPEVAAAETAAGEHRRRDRENRQTRPEATSTAQGRPSRKAGEDSETPEDEKSSAGRSQAGRSAQAQSAGGQSNSEDSASAQAQPTRSGAKKKSPPKKQKPRRRSDRRKNAVPAKAPDEKESAASAGRGRGRGANRSPTGSDWSSKDQVTSEDEDESEDDDDVDDDDEESEARGGLQPNLRQRKPPVNRDLTISFGGGKPPPFANGRGGPGLPKKQRGVAQLILGVPFPDHITGQPNPGMTKVTQERVEPKPQPARPVQAGQRTPRRNGMGQLKYRILRPWMRQMLRAFYRGRGSQETKES